MAENKTVTKYTMHNLDRCQLELIYTALSKYVPESQDESLYKDIMIAGIKKELDNTVAKQEG